MSDILHNSDNDLDISSGDFRRVEGPDQPTRVLLVSNQGDWKNSPVSGCNLLGFVNAGLNRRTRNAITQRVRLQLQLHNLKYSSVSITNSGQIIIQ